MRVRLCWLRQWMLSCSFPWPEQAPLYLSPWCTLSRLHLEFCCCLVARTSLLPLECKPVFVEPTLPFNPVQLKTGLSSLELGRLASCEAKSLLKPAIFFCWMIILVEHDETCQEQIVLKFVWMEGMWGFRAGTLWVLRSFEQSLVGDVSGVLLYWPSPVVAVTIYGIWSNKSYDLHFQPIANDMYKYGFPRQVGDVWTLQVHLLMTASLSEWTLKITIMHIYVYLFIYVYLINHIKTWCSW